MGVSCAPLATALSSVSFLVDETIEQFEEWQRHLANLPYREAQLKLKGFRDWVLKTNETKQIVDHLWPANSTAHLFSEGQRGPKMINAASPKESAAVGWDFITLLAEKRMSADEFAFSYDFRPGFRTNRVQDYFDVAGSRYIVPAIEAIRRELERSRRAELVERPGFLASRGPAEIQESLKRFERDYPDSSQCGFIMMRFARSRLHDEIAAAIRNSLQSTGLIALRADDKAYHEDLFSNVVTYMHGCSFGIAVLERLEVEEFNPNVSLEIGYMKALGKPVCLLKDSTLDSLPVDLLGKLYQTFDAQNPGDTIPTELGKWLRDWNRQGSGEFS